MASASGGGERRPLARPCTDAACPSYATRTPKRTSPHRRRHRRAQNRQQCASTKLAIAHDCGVIVNPNGLRNQIEGNAIQAMSRALKEAGRVQYQRRHQPRLAHLSDRSLQRGARGRDRAGRPAARTAPGCGRSDDDRHRTGDRKRRLRRDRRPLARSTLFPPTVSQPRCGKHRIMDRRTILAGLAAGACRRGVADARPGRRPLAHRNDPARCRRRGLLRQRSRVSFATPALTPRSIRFPAARRLSRRWRGGAVDIGFSNLISIAVAYKHNVPVTLDRARQPLHGEHPDVGADGSGQFTRPRPRKTSTARRSASTVSKRSRSTLRSSGSTRTAAIRRTVKFVEMTFPQILAALAADRIDAAIVADPFIAQAKPAARVLSDAYDAIGSRYIIGCWFTTTQWASSAREPRRPFRPSDRQHGAVGEHPQTAERRHPGQIRQDGSRPSRQRCYASTTRRVSRSPRCSR